MANFEELIGFYTVSGSRDFPKSWNPNNKFGFNDGSSTPVFNYSYMETLDAFEIPVVTSKVISLLDAPVKTDIANLILNVPEGETLNIDTNAGPYKTVFDILKFVFVNRDTVDAQAIHDEFNSVDHYVNDYTTIIRNDVDSDRINYVTFHIDMANVGDDPDLVLFKIYLYPDQYILNESDNRYKVYLYEDMDGDDLINTTEWRERIIDKHIEIFNTGRYKFVKELSTTFVENNVYTTRTFYVYTLIEDFNNTEVINAVKEFILLNHTYQYAVEHYPDLFGGFVVNVHPINNLDASGVQFITPVSYSKIKSTLNDNGYDRNYNNYLNAEVFNIGNEADTGINFLLMPFIAVEAEASSLTRPVSDAYPDYTPRYVTYDNNYQETGSKPLTFHHMLFLSSCVVLGFIPENDSRLDNIPVELQFTINKPDTVIESVSFKILNTTYIIHKL